MRFVFPGHLNTKRMSLAAAIQGEEADTVMERRRLSAIPVVGLTLLTLLATLLAAAPASAQTDTIFGASAPATIDSGDGHSVVVGVKFRSEVPGTVTGVRFYKASTNTGTHIGSLWSSTGTQLASATFTGESTSGWQQVNFTTPVTIAANTTYIASYIAPKGHYSDTSSGFASSGVSNPPLAALANGTSPNGVYVYSAANAFPTNSYRATNYWVDVSFEPTPSSPPGQVTKVSATAGLGSATVNWNAPTSGGPVTAYTITPYIGTKAQTATTLSGSPPATSTTINGLSAGTAYTFTVQASNSSGAGPTSEPSNPVTPTAPTAPEAPTGVSATAGDSSASVSWTAPANGGSAITSYTVTPYVGSTAQPSTVVSGNPPVTTATINGLTNGTSYTFTVSASNAIGTGPASSPSGAVTPRTGADRLPRSPGGGTGLLYLRRSAGRQHQSAGVRAHQLRPRCRAA